MYVVIQRQMWGFIYFNCGKGEGGGGGQGLLKFTLFKVASMKYLVDMPRSFSLFFFPQQTKHNQKSELGVFETTKKRIFCIFWRTA